MIDWRPSRILRPSGALALACLVVALSAFSGAASAVADDATVLTNVDIVQRVLAGESADVLIALIRASETVEFDLTDEMQDELTIAGVPTAVVKAMVERQAALDLERNPPPADEETIDAAAATPSIRILINADRPADEGPTVLNVLDLVPPPSREHFGLRDDVPRFTDIGLFLGCLTADHVPDHWRTQTPLGRDFVEAPRHKLLAFVSGAVGVADHELSRRLDLSEGAEPAKLLRLEIPAYIDADLDPDVVHDLVLGIALQAEGRFYLVASSGWGGVVANGRVLTHARVSTGTDPLKFALEVLFDHSADEGVGAAAVD